MFIYFCNCFGLVADKTRIPYNVNSLEKKRRGMQPVKKDKDKKEEEKKDDDKKEEDKEEEKKEEEKKEEEKKEEEKKDEEEKKEEEKKLIEKVKNLPRTNKKYSKLPSKF